MIVTFVTTVLNEEKNIEFLLSSIYHQTRRPDEVIIVDGGSNDNTVGIIKDWISKLRSEKLKKGFKVVIKKGNRSVGRNEGIRRAKGEIIALSDSGCILDRNWMKEIYSPFNDPQIDVVAGYYKGIPRSHFEKSLIPYVLVMPDKVDPNGFLPSGRSMALRKSVWIKTGGFPIRYSKNEDFVFAQKLKKEKFNIRVRKSAVVYWLPRKNFWQAFLMFFNFASGDAEAGILRGKVILLLARYTFALWLLLYSLLFSTRFMLQVFFYILVVYISWSILKSYRYIKERQAFILLPLIQFISDMAVISGTILGFIKSVWVTQSKR